MSTQAEKQSDPKPTRGFLQLLLALFIMLCLLFMYSFTNRLLDRFQVQADIARWQQLTEQAKDRQVALLSELEYVQSDQYIEQVAREELGMTRSGDEVIIRVPVKTKKITPENPQSEDIMNTFDQEAQGQISAQPLDANSTIDWQEWFSWILPKTDSNLGVE